MSHYSTIGQCEEVDAIIAAIMGNKIDTIEKYAQAGFDFNQSDCTGYTFPILAAALSGNQAILDLLLKNGADINFNVHGYTALYNTVETGEHDATLMLIKAGADVNWRAENNKTVLMRAVEDPLSRDVLEQLLQAHADVNAQDNDGNTPLFYYCKKRQHNYTYYALDLLIKWDADINHLNKKANTLIKLMSEATINSKPNNGQTALMKAIKGAIISEEFHFLDIITMLIDKGADVNASDKSKKTPLMYAVAHVRGENYAMAREIVKLLIDKGANVNAEDNGRHTALEYAYDLEIIKTLLAQGAVLYQNEYFMAAYGKHLDIMKYYLELDPNMINATFDDDDGITMLMALFKDENSNYKIKDKLDYLLANGADVNAKNKYGETALTYAVWLMNNEPTLNYVSDLLAAGADPNVRDINGYSPSDHCENDECFDAFGVTRNNQNHFPKSLDVVELEMSNLRLRRGVEVFDTLMAQNYPLMQYLDENPENVVFLINERNGFGYDVDQLRAMTIGERNYYFKCLNVSSGLAVSLTNIDGETPYVLLRAAGTFYVPAEQLQAALDSDYSIFVLEEFESLDATASIDVVASSPPIRNFRGEQINVVSKDHCQAGSNKKSYHIKIFKNKIDG